MTTNEKAFLDMIAWAEIGPAVLQESDDGYNVLVGSLPGKVRLFYEYHDHPRIVVQVHSRGNVIHSSAAGRYQIVRRNFDFYRRPLRLKGFYPEDQDKIALHLIRECRAIEDIDSGRIEQAIIKCRSRWASLPGAGYGQPEKRLADLLQAYERAGGATE